MVDFYHLCFAVQDLEEAQAELADVVGVEWNAARSGHLADWDFRLVFSTGGPPFFELIEGPPGSPWDVSATGPRFDHLGYWTPDLPVGQAAFGRQGARLDFDSCPHGGSMSLHTLPAVGARIELVDAANQDSFRQRWAPDAGPMAALIPRG